MGRGGRMHALGDLPQVLGDKCTGDVAQRLGASERLLQLEHLAVTKPLAKAGHHRHVRAGKAVD